jgi:hypothetical protein
LFLDYNRPFGGMPKNTKSKDADPLFGSVHMVLRPLRCFGYRNHAFVTFCIARATRRRYHSTWPVTFLLAHANS